MSGVKESLDFAFLLLKEEKVGEARLILDSTLKNSPHNTRAKFLLARCMMAERRWEEALELWVDVLVYDQREVVIVNLLRSALKAQHITKFKFYVEKISQNSESLQIFKYVHHLMFAEQIVYSDCLLSDESQQLFVRLIASEVSEEGYSPYNILVKRLIDGHLSELKSIKLQSWILTVIQRLGDTSLLNKLLPSLQLESLSSRSLHLLVDFIVRSRGACQANTFISKIHNGPTKEMLYEKVVRIEGWKKLNRSAGETFFDLMYNISVSIAARRFDEANVMLQSAINTYPEHYYPRLIKIQLLKLVRPYDLNVDLLEEIIEISPMSLSVQLEVLDSYSRFFRFLNIKKLVETICQDFPLNPFVRDVAKRYGIPVLSDNLNRFDYSNFQQTDKVFSFLHSGDLGDIIYCLPAIRSLGKGILYLICKHDTRNSISEYSINFISELLLRSGYIVSVKLWQGEPIDYDFTEVRKSQSPTKNIALAHWEHICPNALLKFDVNSSWLSVSADVKARDMPPVFARSARYRSEEIWGPIWKSFKASHADANFVGTQEEFVQFSHGNLLQTPTALKMAEAIWNAKFFVGNQSLPYSLAEALKVPRILERSPVCPNCDFTGAIAF